MYNIIGKISREAENSDEKMGERERKHRKHEENPEILLTFAGILL